MNSKHFLLLLATAIITISCFRGRRITGSGNVISEKRTTGDFTAVQAEGIMPVEVKNGPQTEVVVEADDNLAPYIYTRVKDGKLVVGLRKINTLRNCTYKVYVTAPVLKQISCSGAGSITAAGVLKDSESISFSSSGVGGIEAEVDAPEVRAKVSGAGHITLSGRTRNLDAQVSGAGSIKSFDLLSETAEAGVSGAGHIDLHASVGLKAKASGAGSIKYRGAASVESSVSGAGNVSKE